MASRNYKIGPILTKLEPLKQYPIFATNFSIFEILIILDFEQSIKASSPLYLSLPGYIG